MVWKGAGAYSFSYRFPSEPPYAKCSLFPRVRRGRVHGPNRQRDSQRYLPSWSYLSFFKIMKRMLVRKIDYSLAPLKAHSIILCTRKALNLGGLNPHFPHAEFAIFVLVMRWWRGTILIFRRSLAPCPSAARQSYPQNAAGEFTPKFENLYSNNHMTGSFQYDTRLIVILCSFEGPTFNWFEWDYGICSQCITFVAHKKEWK